MSDIAIPSNTPFADGFHSAAKRTDIMFALGLVIILAILLVPMPSILMDIFFAISIAFSVMILMTSLFLQKPLELSSFPTILLVSTMLRLSLNIASTRLILSKGHEGTNAAGKVIEAFGEFVMGGNFVIGIIVFAILVIVNFVVITKGSGRIAEVAARFTLDAMPGKQMAIDADMSSGLIDEMEARKRRKELESESNFYGAMDGASKFVRGDAIAGLLITFINIIGGIIIGVVQMKLDFSKALETYTLLTVGDGIVTQIPALIVSTAAGMLVSKGGVEGSADEALFGQLSAHPAALGMCSFLMLTIGVLPGIPMLPFLLLALLSGGLAWFVSQKSDRIQAEKDAFEVASQMPTLSEAENISKSIENTKTAPQVDLIRVELGYGLLPLINQENATKLPDQIKMLRTQFANDLGFILPSVRLQDNLHLDPDAYVILIRETVAGRGEIRPGKLLIMDPEARAIELQGEQTTEPSFGLPAMWVGEEMRQDAEARHYTVVDPGTVLSTHISEIVKDNISDLLTFADVQRMLENLNDSYKKLLNDIVPTQLNVGGIQRILQNLISERVSIRDLPSILEGIAEGSAYSRNLSLVTEHVRARLMRQITFSNLDDQSTLPIVVLTPEWEERISNALIGDMDNRQLALAPSDMQEFISKVRGTFDQLGYRGENPILVTSALIRPFVRSILERARPSTIIMSQTEVHPKVRIRQLGQLS